MEGEVLKQNKLDDGLHNGIIIELTKRTSPFEYLDVTIQLADNTQIKASYPAKLYVNSKLGNLLARFGAILQEGTVIIYDEILINKKCSFVTITKGNFANVDADSVKPFVVETNTGQ